MLRKRGIQHSFEDYGKLNKDDEAIEAHIKTLENAVNAHAKDNRDKRKALQERRNMLAKQLKALTEAMQQGQLGLNDLHQQIEANLRLAKHAETWERKQPARSTGLPSNE
jgi:chromosome segregation ATPase